MAHDKMHNIDLVKLDLEVRQMRAEALRYGMQKFSAWLKRSFKINAVRGHQAA